MDAIYARQSVDKKDSLSIDGQIELCRRYSGTEVQIFRDKGFSGKNTNRPDFHRLMEAVEAGQVNKIIVYRLDRFSRSIADFGQVWDRLERCHVEFVSVTENFDTSSPMGRAMLNIVLVFAQLERETIAERVRDNYVHRFSLGAWPGGPAPYGYSLTKIVDENGRRVSSLVENGKAPVVLRIFELYARENTSLRSVAQTLNAEGIPGPKRETWDNVSLSRMLHSPLYTNATEDVYWWYLARGVRCGQPVDAFDGTHACNVIGRRDRSGGKYNDPDRQQLSLSNHRGFVPAELWLACQEKLDRNTRIAAGVSGKHSWLTGLLKCASCGYAVKINHDRGTGRCYLICSNRTNMGMCGQTIRIDLRELEDGIARQLREILRDCPAEEVYPEDNGAAKELGQIEERIGRLVDALAESSAVSAAYISAQIDRLHARREKITQELKADAGRRSKKSRLDFDRASMEEKRIIAREFIDRILLSEDSADVVWKI